MKKSILFSLAALALAATACYKPLLKEAPAEAPKNLVRITVSAEKEIGGEDPESKVTYDPSTNKFGFDSDDKLQLLIGAVADDAITAQKNVILDMDPNHLGTFTGTIDLGDYALSDIRGAFLVKSAYSNANLFMNGTNLAMRSYVVSSQTQSAGDVFTSGNGRAIFYTHIKSDWVHQQDDKITIDHLTLKLGSSIWEFHIYGADRTGEKIKSVTVAAHSNTGNTANYTGCQEFFLVSNGNYANYGGNKYFSNTVTLTNPVSVGAEANSSPSIWLGIVGLGTALKTGVVTIITDKAIYTRDFDGAEKKRERGAIYPFNINIGSSGSFTRKTLEYSTDGGNTWMEWIDKLPDDVTTYTSLSLRQSHVALTADHLTAIKDWIEQQNNPVSLDLSGIKYTDTTFPDTFKGTSNGGINNTNGITVKAAGTKIKSIKFPSNVTAIAASAFNSCTALEAVDLTGIKSIGSNAFCNTALVTLDVPASVTSIGNLAFAYCWDLTNVTYHPKTEVNTANCFIFGCRNNKVSYADCPDKYKAENLIPLTFRFAKGARVLKYMFDTNHKLQTLIFEGDPNENGVGADAWLIRCRFLKTIDCSALTKVMAFTKTNASGIGEQIADGAGSIILPTGLATTGWGLWNTLDSGAKYSITSAE